MISSIDILITTRNRLHDLRFTLEHCLAIGFQQDQIWIVDDASTDCTCSIVQTMFPNVNIKGNEVAKGYIANRNWMMLSSSRPYILSLDDDSHIRSHQDILDAIKLLQSDPSYGIFHFHAFEQLPNPPKSSELPKSVRIIRSYIGCGHIIKREVIHKLGKYREEFEFYCEELDYSIRAYMAGYKVVTQDNLVVHHRIDWEQRSLQFESDLSKGVYGALYRSTLGFSNHLLIVNLYFPFLFRQFFTLYYCYLRFLKFYIKKGDKAGFVNGWKRFRSFRSYNKKERNPLSFSLFFSWIKLDVR